MNIQDYQFNIGDEVITTEGIRGKITSVCHCDKCQERGFYEPFWIAEDGKFEHCIDIYEAKSEFACFYKIGKYRFNDFNKGEILRALASYEDGIKLLKKQLRVIEEIEGEEVKNDES